MKYIALILLILPITIFAQEQSNILEATTDKNVFLFFPSPIEKALSGNGDFQFGYNTQTAEKFGVLKAVAAKGESTLHVITEDQSVYSFIVKYNPNITKYEYFFDTSNAVGSINGKKENSNPPLSASHPEDSNLELGRKITEADYFEAKVDNVAKEDISFCKKLLEKGDYYKNIYRSKSDVVLKLTNIAYKDDKTFICLSIKNDSPVDFDLNFIQFNKIAKKASKKANYQAIEINPILESSYQTFERIESMTTKSAVYVFQKLSIDKNKLVNIEVNEKQGERNIELPVDYKLINNPNSNY